MLGESFGLTADTNNYWYVDGKKTTVGTNTVVVIVGFDPISGAGVPTEMFIPSAAWTGAVLARLVI